MRMVAGHRPSGDLTRAQVLPVIRRALREDQALSDLTSNTVLERSVLARARILARASGMLAGVQVCSWTFQAVDRSLRCVVHRPDGQPVRRGATILTVEGRARPIFAAERTALNLLGHLSGIATLTRRFVSHTTRESSTILDTRKTLPGLRLLEKYAVRVGGGRNHRFGLQDAVLIKTNHLIVLARQRRGGTTRDAVGEAVRRARRRRHGRMIQVEVRTLPELRAALRARPDAILLDNWRLPAIRAALALREDSPRSTTRRRPWLEVSGGVTLGNIRAIARTGVERISVGRLTHSAPALDVALEVIR